MHVETKRKEKISIWAYIYKANKQLTNMVDTIGPVSERRGIDWLSIRILLWMKLLEPEITPQRSIRLFPYSHPDRIWAAFSKAEEQGLIQSRGLGNQYKITKLGRSIIDEVNDLWAQEISRIEPISENNLKNLEKSLCRAVDTCWNLPFPLDKFVSESIRRVEPTEDAPVMEKIDHYLSILFFLRDDVHNFVWIDLGFDAHPWEIVTTLWRKKTANLDVIIEALSRRGYPQGDTERALSGLLDNGMVSGFQGIYRLTEQGIELREKAEERTEELYDAALLALTVEEIFELRRLLKLFCSGIRKIRKNGVEMH